MSDNNIDALQQMFADVDHAPADDLPEDMIVDIPIDEINVEAQTAAEDLIDNLRDLYADQEFLDSNPGFKKRLFTEVDNLRVLLKMRKADEVTHDSIIAAISKKSENASLYRALTDIQRTMLNISKQIDDKVNGINNLIKNIQLEFNFEKKKENEENEEELNNHFRGSKDFIKKMRDDLKV